MAGGGTRAPGCTALPRNTVLLLLLLPLVVEAVGVGLAAVGFEVVGPVGAEDPEDDMEDDRAVLVPEAFELRLNENGDADAAVVAPVPLEWCWCCCMLPIRGGSVGICTCSPWDCEGIPSPCGATIAPDNVAALWPG